VTRLGAVLVLLYEAQDGQVELRILSKKGLMAHSHIDQGVIDHTKQASPKSSWPDCPSRRKSGLDRSQLHIHRSPSLISCRSRLCTESRLQYREAHEEVGLPLDSPHIFTLCCLRPFVSLYRLWVTPVVAFLSAPSLLKDLKPSPDEVDHIFTHPLEAFLDVNHAKGEPLVDIGSEDWPYNVELYVRSQPIPSDFTLRS
jgi:hypothetical protein